MVDARQHEEQSRLGAILVRFMGLPLRTLQQALDRQKRAPERRLGDILLEMEAIDAGQLEQALARQRVMRHR